MAQGKRGLWARVAAAGLGVLLGTGLVGCTNNDRPKGVQKAGLPGTPTLPANAGGLGRIGQPNQFNTTGANQAGGPASPAAGMGMGTTGAGQQRFGSAGMNTLNSGGGNTQPAGFNTLGNTPGQPGGIGAPVQPGLVPSGAGPLGAAPSGANHGSVAGAFGPPPPSLDSMPLPPPAPGESVGPLPPAGSAAPYSLSNAYRQ